MTDATDRFSNRVADYVRSRPSYPAAAIDLLRTECGLGPGSRVADVGAGTGIFTVQLLEAGAHVVAIEPNGPMREAAVGLLSGRERCEVTDGTAEATGLGDASVDLITAAQAFHWFDRPAARREFVRILRPGGHVALLWNERRSESTPFLHDYELLLREGSVDYAAVNHRNVGVEKISDFFAPSQVQVRSFEYEQHFDWQGLQARVLSSSYVPGPDDPRQPAFVELLRRLFDQHANNGSVTWEYDTWVYYGTLD